MYITEGKDINVQHGNGVICKVRQIVLNEIALNEKYRFFSVWVFFFFQVSKLKMGFYVRCNWMAIYRNLFHGKNSRLLNEWDVRNCLVYVLKVVVPAFCWWPILSLLIALFTRLKKTAHENYVVGLVKRLCYVYLGRNSSGRYIYNLASSLNVLAHR